MAVAPTHRAVFLERTADESPAPIVVLRRRVADFDLSDRERERGWEVTFQTVFTADSALTGSFPSTLTPTIAPMTWTRYPQVEEAPYAACVVTYLGSADDIHGWWLHYTQLRDESGEPQPALTLIAPCACGTYIDVKVRDEDALIVMLDELDTAPGAPVACDYHLRIRSHSYADPAHNSFLRPSVDTSPPNPEASPRRAPAASTAPRSPQ
ncbi:hypothetical protein ACWCXB_34580 [Streptomyces sp. NPDC001514]